MAAVGEAFLFGTLEILLERIASSQFRDFFRNRKLNVSLLDELKITLLALNAVLNDAEEKQITNHAVKEWLDGLKDAVFDAEDLLDKINTDSLRSRVEEDSPTMANQVRSFFSSHFKSYSQMNSKLEALTRRLEHFAKQKDILGLQSVSGRVSYRTTTTSLVNESVVVGREDDKKELLNLLLSDHGANGTDIGVITILGMGGLGKTTLAQLLYNDKKVQEHFDLKAWACVSEDYDVFKVTKNLVESVTKKDCNVNNLDLLRVELRQSLRDKIFLIVLDDLWNDKYNDWDDFITPFNGGKRGSRIIVTTRQERVAEVTHTFPVHKPNFLSEENCWFLLSKHALSSEVISEHPDLEAIGRKIAKKCGGLPIAAKTLSGLLRSKLDLKEWNRILNSNLWELPHDDIIPALQLSYLYLPAQMKRCFAYCSIFPKDHLLDRKDLILLWMAEGLLEQPHGTKMMELAGHDCFNELLSRSLIQPYNVAKDRFFMHDLIHDLATVVSGKSCFSFNKGNEIPKDVRHLSYCRERYDSSKKFECFYELKSLRTFLPLFSWICECYLSKKVTYDLLPNLRCLRVLSLSKYDNITELPNSIGKLVHLRYLDLSNTAIKRLPDEMCTLYNLQILILSDCNSLTELPAQIGNLINLRHLYICDTNLMEMPKQICRLQNLRSLTAFVVGRQRNGLRVRELRNFPHLQGRLSILKLQNVVDTKDAFEANLKNKETIEELVLEWGSDTQDSEVGKDVLDHLQPSSNLRKLAIKFYGGSSFPRWIGDSSFSHLISLSISDCNYCSSLPPFGQLPSLKKLFIIRMNLVQTVGPEFYGGKVLSSSFQSFPLLENLTFEEMSNWQEWLPCEDDSSKLHFPCLKRLHLRKCPKLRKYLPDRLPSVTEVNILECNQLEAKASSLNWNASIEVLHIGEGGQSLLSMVESDSPCSPYHLEIEVCDSLQSLPKILLSSKCLQELHLEDVPSVVSFPIDGLPISLRSLEIGECENLEFLPHETWQNYTSLENLTIRDSCHSLISFPLGGFPRLKELCILGCPNLESFTRGRESSPHLVKMDVHEFENLKSLSEVHVDNLMALEILGLVGLPDLQSFPDGGLPSNLLLLQVLRCPKLPPIAEWGLQQLTSLSSFQVGGEEPTDPVNTLPARGRLLPTSLLYLTISGLSDIKHLEGNWLRHLTSLEVLRIVGCPSLESLPEDALPPSLMLLVISKCPKLEARYQRKKGRHWSKIAHISAIRINDDVII